MIIFNNILKMLSDSGWSAYRLRKEKQISSGTIDRIRANKSISTETIDTICRLCHCQPGDIMSYKDEKDEE